jgi:hypothetical protein
MMENMNVPADCFQWILRPERGEGVGIFPEEERTCADLLYQSTEPFRLSGYDNFPAFIAMSAALRFLIR